MKRKVRLNTKEVNKETKMKCLEPYTIEQVKEMPPSELKVLWDIIVEEKQAMDMRITIVNMLEIMEAKKPLIES